MLDTQGTCWTSCLQIMFLVKCISCMCMSLFTLMFQSLHKVCQFCHINYNIFGKIFSLLQLKNTAKFGSGYYVIHWKLFQTRRSFSRKAVARLPLGRGGGSASEQVWAGPGDVPKWTVWTTHGEGEESQVKKFEQMYVVGRSSCGRGRGVPSVHAVGGGVACDLTCNTIMWSHGRLLLCWQTDRHDWNVTFPKLHMHVIITAQTFWTF